MRALKTFGQNAAQFAQKTAKHSLLIAGMAMGGMTNAQQQSASDEPDERDRPYIGYFGVSRVSASALGTYNPYETGTVLSIGGEVPLSDNPKSVLKHFGLKGEYAYYLADPHQITQSWNFQQWNQNAHMSFSFVPSRAQVALTAKTPEIYRAQVMAYGGLLAYPGDAMNWANMAHGVFGVEARADILPKRSPINFKAFAGVEHIMYNKDFLNHYFTPDANSSTALKAGIRLTMATNPRL